MNLAIFKVNQLGDNVVFLPVVQALRARFPQWRIVVFTSPVAAELFAGDLPPAQIHALPTATFNSAWKRPWELLRLAARVRRERFDASLVATDQGNVAHFLARAGGGRVRVGMRAAHLKMPGGLTDHVEIAPDLNASLRNWELARVLVRRLAGASWPDVPPAPDLRHLAGDAAPIHGRIVIHPGASGAYKRWFPDRFQELAARLATRFEVLWLEQADTRALALPPAVTRLEPSTIAELTRTLRTASLFIGNNSGPMNIAFALGCPSVILTGASSPTWDPLWHAERMQMLRALAVPCVPCDGPWQPALVCRNAASPMACMAYWSVAEVERRCIEWQARWAGLATGAGRATSA